MLQQLASFFAHSYGIMSAVLIVGLGVMFTRVMLSGKGFIEFDLLASTTLSAITIGYASSTQLVRNTEPLGVVERIEVQAGLFKDLSTIQTPSGFYQVRGAVSAKKGDQLRLEERALGSDKVCIGDSCYTSATQLRLHLGRVEGRITSP